MSVYDLKELYVCLEKIDKENAKNELLKEVLFLKENLIPEKTKKMYIQEFEKYKAFVKGDSVDVIVCEENILAYISYLHRFFVPSSLVTKLSMLKSVILKEFSKDIFIEFPVVLKILKTLH